MRILLTNDDGIESPGIEALQQELQRFDSHEIWIVAPDGDRSGMSHYISLKEPIRSRKLGDRRYSITGSPADSVLTAFLGIMPQRPDVVISGINLGPNLGTDIVYSGTAAAARQAAYMGVPGIAVSVNAYEAPWHFDIAALFVAKNLDLFVNLFDGDHFININTPGNGKTYQGIEVTHPCYRTYNDRLEHYVAPRGEEYWFLQGAPIDTSDEEGSDWNAVERGNISVSPIHLHPLNNQIDEEFGLTEFRSPADVFAKT